jgi:chaperonin GroEL
METLKTKSAAKLVVPKSPALEKKILDTMAIISQIVGGTLGPGGRPVLIERQEYNLPPQVTKDGVTVFRSLGFQDAVQHSILESIRDVSVRTAQEAGDGTTTATILSEAFVRYTTDFCKKNPTVPSIFIIKTIQNLFRDVMSPAIERLTVKCDFEDPKGKKNLWSVAKISGNGDTELADAVMKCFEITGDEGNVTIVETTGKTAYEVEKVDGYPLTSGYEESAGKFYSAFINDPATQRVIMEKPIFLLYYGRVSDFATCFDIIDRIQNAFLGKYMDCHNVVFIATGFSEGVLANLASIFTAPSNINVLPVVVSKNSPIMNSERHLFEDIAAITGSVIFDPVTKPLSGAEFEDLGNLVKEEQVVNGAPIEVYVPMGIKSFECGRYRSTVIGHCDEEILLEQIDKVKAAIPNTEGELDTRYFQERLAKLSGGIAKLKVIGSSNGELKERRDRAEDSVCAIRGALKHGALIGGGWTLVRIAKELSELQSDPLVEKIVDEIVNPSLLNTLGVLFSNAGLDSSKQDPAVGKSIVKGDPKKAIVTNIATGQAVNALEEGILDSVPALLEALRNSIAGATLLGTVGGVIVFPRDQMADVAEARDANDFARQVASGMENERV